MALSDDFTTQDNVKWTYGSPASVVSSQLKLTNPGSVSYGGIVSATNQDLTGYTALAQLVTQNAAGTAGTIESYIKAEQSANAGNYFLLGISGSALVAYSYTSSSPTAIYNVGGSYSGTWLRIRESGGTTFFDKSPDGITWTNLGSIANPWAVTSMKFSVVIGHFNATDNATSTFATWDNFNNPPGVTAIAASDLGYLQDGAAPTQQIIVPAYFSPGAIWTRMQGQSIANGGKTAIAIMNPASGPGGSVDSTYVTQVAAAKAAGLQVYGYIPTTTGAPSTANLKASADSYFSWYSVDGIFWDETVGSDTSNVTKYTDICSYVTGKGGRSILNFGTTCLQTYVTIGDYVCTFEGDSTAYATWTPASWELTYSTPSQIYHLVYGITDTTDLDRCVILSRRRNVGSVYFTDDVLVNPWDTIPPDPIWLRENSNLISPGSNSIASSFSGSETGHPTDAVVNAGPRADLYLYDGDTGTMRERSSLTKSTWRFTPASVPDYFQIVGCLFITINEGQSVLKTAGVYRVVDSPLPEDIEAADAVYLGGRSYAVSDTEIAALTAAGYGAFITLMAEPG